jgi:type I restriction enzyme, S subunit
MTFQRYDSYKGSGVEWLGQVPSHWRMVPLKHLAEFINGDAFKPTEWAEAGIPIIRIQNLNGSEDFNYFDGEVEQRYMVHDEDLLFGWSGNRGTSFGPFVWRRQEICVLNQHIFRVVPRSMDKRGLYWILKAVTGHVEDQAHGIIGMVHVTKGDLGAISVPVPPAVEQTDIAAFLGHETAKIDNLVEEQKRLIELLKEKRQAVISHAVTKGLNPNAPMKDSGVGWLGEVPAHWSVGALGYFATIDTGATPDRANPTFWGGSIPWIKTGEINYLPIREAEERITDVGLANSSTRVADPGTMLMAMYGQGITRGRVAILEVAAAYNQACAAISFGPLLHAPFGRYFFMAAYECIRDLGNETSQMNLGAGVIRKIKLTAPTLDEQERIVFFLDSETAKIEYLLLEAERAITLLQERRTALISAAVTGKIDVRPAQAIESGALSNALQYD